MIATRCNKCNSFLQSCNCNGFKPLEILSAGKKPKTEEEIKQLILKLDRYYCQSCQSFAGIYADMTQDNDGEYVRLEDVLNIFAAKKE